MRKDDSDAIREGFMGLEDGFVYFFYRPRSLEARSVQDVSRLYFVLHPLDKKRYRLISLDTSRIPSEMERFNMINGKVDRITDRPGAILHELREITEQVRGSLEIRTAAARPCGEGVYTLIKSENRVHLLYAIELPANDGKILHNLGLANEGDMEIGVYNPYYEIDENEEPLVGPPLPEPLRKKLDNEVIAYEDIPELLNYEGINITLNRKSSHLSDQARTDLHPLKHSERSSNILSDLKLRRDKNPVEPLFNDEWR